MVERLYADCIGLEIRVNEYEAKGRSVAQALHLAQGDLVERNEKFRPSGRHGGSWVDNGTLVALARHYHFDAYILNPDASFTVVEEKEGHQAPHIARIALVDLHYRALVPRSSPNDTPVVLDPVPQSFFERAATHLNKRREQLEAVSQGVGTVADLEPVDRRMFLGQAHADPVATRATAQGIIELVGRAQARLILASAAYSQRTRPNPTPIAQPPVGQGPRPAPQPTTAQASQATVRPSIAQGPAASPARAPCPPPAAQCNQSSQSNQVNQASHAGRPRQSPPRGAARDIPAIVAELVEQARAVPPVGDKWRSCLKWDLGHVTDKETKARIRQLLADDDATAAPLPQTYPTA